jgi:hypothetical protein
MSDFGKTIGSINSSISRYRTKVGLAIATSASIALPGMLKKSVLLPRSFALIWVVRILVEVDLLDLS